MTQIRVIFSVETFGPWLTVVHLSVHSINQFRQSRLYKAADGRATVTPQRRLIQFTCSITDWTVYQPTYGFFYIFIILLEAPTAFESRPLGLLLRFPCAVGSHISSVLHVAVPFIVATVQCCTFWTTSNT